jgi:hypothetical protein
MYLWYVIYVVNPSTTVSTSMMSIGSGLLVAKKAIGVRTVFFRNLVALTGTSPSMSQPQR